MGVGKRVLENGSGPVTATTIRSCAKWKVGSGGGGEDMFNIDVVNDRC
jgi:hypothetical protein